MIHLIQVTKSTDYNTIPTPALSDQQRRNTGQIGYKMWMIQAFGLLTVSLKIPLQMVVQVRTNVIQQLV